MSSIRNQWSTVLLPLMVFATIAGRPARAQFVINGNDQQIQVTKENLIQNVFRNQQTVSGARDDASTALSLHVDFVALIGNLSDEQRERLELAGRGDIHRFFTDFEAYLDSAPTGQISMQQWNQIWQDLRPLQTRYFAGLHGQDSLFRKTVPTTLDERQRIAYEELEAERSSRHYRAIAQATLSVIDGQVPLSTAQREQIIRVLMEKTKPPRTYGQSYYRYFIVLYQMSRIEDELKPLFSDDEWRVMQMILQKGRQYEHMLRDNFGVEFD